MQIDVILSLGGKFDRRYSPFRCFIYGKNVRRIRRLARRGRRVLAKVRGRNVARG